MESSAPWWRATVRRADGTELAGVSIGGAGRPDLAAVGLVAGLVVWARRSGGDLVVRQVSGDFEELADLAGLRGQVLGQAEPGEDLLGVEEEGHGADAAP